MSQLQIYYDGIRSEVAEVIPKSYSKILEIGCGRGGFSENIKTNSEYWGVEPNIEAAEIAEKTLDKVLVGTFDDIFDQLPNNYFDLIICNDVIEHMVDHHSFYEKIKVKCTDNARMIGSLPNVRFILNLYHLLIKKDWQYKDEGILDKTHLRFFTYKSIKRDFISSGFTIDKLYGINEIHFSRKEFYGWKMILFQFILGQDTKFLQFCFSVKLK